MDEVNKLGKILIVDDNEDVLFALNLLLEPYTEKIKVNSAIYIYHTITSSVQIRTNLVRNRTYNT